MNSKDDLVSKVREAYERALEEEKRAREEVRVKAYKVGKLKGLIVSLEMLEKTISGFGARWTDNLATELRLKSEVLSKLPQSEAKAREDIVREIEELATRMRLLRKALEELKKELSKAITSEIEKIRDSMM